MQSLYTNNSGLVGNSEAIANICKAIKLLEGRDLKVALISGEIGTQKGAAASLLHKQSTRRDHPMLNIDCHDAVVCIDKEIQSEDGKGCLSNYKGIICLNDIDALPLDSQQKLLDIVRNSENNGNAISIIAITSVDLKKAVKENKFNRDLYEYLSRFHIHMPALRERISDIPTISTKILKEVGNDIGTQMLSLEPEAIEVLTKYNWPGNIRQLGAILEQAAFYYPTEKEFKAEFIPHYLHSTTNNKVVQVSADMKLPKHGVVLEELEKNLLKQALEQMLGNQSRAAKLLGISRFALRYRMEKYGLFPKTKEEILAAESDKWRV